MMTAPNPIFGRFRLDGRASRSAPENDDEPRRPRKRQRTIQSCDQCHRAKVKCDRLTPCGRCTARKRESQCSYQDRSLGRGATKSASQVKGDAPPSPPAEWKHPMRLYYPIGSTTTTGLTHWAKLVDEFKDAKRYIFDWDEEFHPTFARLAALKDLYPMNSIRNFPFGDIPKVSQAKILESLPSRTMVQDLVDNYMLTFEKTHRLLHPAQFRRELLDFYAAPEDVSQTWFAQFLMMLSLSCASASSHLSPDLDALGQDCILWAQNTLRRSNFMDYPDLCAIRALCMMSILKCLNGKAPQAATSGSLCGFNGFIVRLAMSMSLHRDASVSGGLTAFEADMRRRIWNTIVFLDLNMAIDSGLPPLIKPNEWETAAPWNLDNDQLRVSGLEVQTETELCALSQPLDRLTDSSFQIYLARCYPVVSEVLSLVNSTRPEMSYEQVEDYDRRIRAVLRDVQTMFVPGRVTSHDAERVLTLQRTMVEVFLRRTLLAFHQQWRLRDGYEKSRLSCLECSLALLYAQQVLYEKGAKSPSMLCFADLYQSDFGVAMLYVILGLQRDDFSDVDPHKSDDSPGLKMPARETTLTALRASMDIVKASVGRSFHLFKIFSGVTMCFAAFEAGEEGTGLHEAMSRAVEEIVVAVTKARASAAAT